MESAGARLVIVTWKVAASAGLTAVDNRVAARMRKRMLIKN